MMRERRRVRPLMIKFWDRDGSAWLPFEVRKIFEFEDIKRRPHGSNVSVGGFVKWVKDRLFLLLPTPFSYQNYLPCLNQTERGPKENSYVEVEGRVFSDYSVVRGVRGAPILLSIPKVIQVLNWREEREEIPAFVVERGEYNYSWFKEDLTFRIEGLEEKQEDFLAFVALSAPPFFGQAGGITSTLYNSARRSTSRQISRELLRVIPPDINRVKVLETPYGSLRLRYKFSLFTASADALLREEEDSKVWHRLAPVRPVMDEVSLSLYSQRRAPVTIQDPPCSLSDIPTVVPEEAYVNVEKRGDFCFDAFKFVISQQMRSPVVENFSLMKIADGLERLRRDFGLSPEQVGRYGFLDANYNARPASVVRMALAHARAKGASVVDEASALRAFDEYFRWNFEYVMEFFEDLLRSPTIYSLSLDSNQRRVLRVIERYDDPNGVDRETIASEVADVSPYALDELLRDLRDKHRLIYEVSPGRFRLI
ncbi:MAG: hypothetical protein QXI12_02435 [Candidatus Methanomethyliaceae archaeon]